MKKFILLTVFIFGFKVYAETLYSKNENNRVICPKGQVAVRDFYYNGEVVCKTDHEITCKKTEGFSGKPPRCLCDEGFDYDDKTQSCFPVYSNLVNLGGFSPFKKCPENTHPELDPSLDEDVCGNMDLFICVPDSKETTSAKFFLNLPKMIEVNYYIVKVGLFDKNENLLETFETYGLRFEETKTLALKNCEAEKDNSSNEFCKLVFWDIETAH